MTDGFGRLAYVYEGLERTVFGGLLAKARTTCLDDLGEADTILILGEGDGRFLLSLLGHTGARVTVLENSAGMLKRAQKRVQVQLPNACTRVTWWHQDALTASLPAAHYDAVVTLFFLDVFPEQPLKTLVHNLSRSLKPGGCWCVTDFAAPHTLSGWVRPYSRILVALMYALFRLQTALPAKTVVPPQPFLRASGLEPVHTRNFRGGFVYTQVWRKRAT